MDANDKAVLGKRSRGHTKPCCTMAAGPTRALTATRPIRAYSTRCPSAWQPNPGNTPLSDAENLFENRDHYSCWLRQPWPEFGGRGSPFLNLCVGLWLLILVLIVLLCAICASLAQRPSAKHLLYHQRYCLPTPFARVKDLMGKNASFRDSISKRTRSTLSLATAQKAINPVSNQFLFDNSTPPRGDPFRKTPNSTTRSGHERGMEQDELPAHSLISRSIVLPSSKPGIRPHCFPAFAHGLWYQCRRPWAFEETMPTPVHFKYHAFLSYAHADVRWANGCTVSSKAFGSIGTSSDVRLRGG